MVNNERAVPALVDLLLVVVEDVGVDVVEALLPRPVLAEQRIGSVLLDGPEGEFRVARVLYDPGIEEQIPHVAQDFRNRT